MRLTAIIAFVAFTAGVSTGLTGSQSETNYKFSSNTTMITADPFVRHGYAAGTLDTLFFVSKNGLPNARIISCIFDGKPWNHIIVDRLAYMEEASKEAFDDGRAGLTPAETFFARLEEDCPPEV